MVSNWIFFNPLFKEEAKMKFYKKLHAHYYGIDLHAKTMYICIQDKNGEVLVHRNMRACPKAFLKTIRPYQEDIVVAVECMFCWYWLADLCTRTCPLYESHSWG